MILRSPRLLCRLPVPGDREAVWRIYADARTSALSPVAPMADPAAADDLLGTWAAHWQARGVGPWAIAAQDAPQQVIGFGGLSWRDFGGQQHPNLWYRLAPEAWGAGYATEFATVALHHAQTVGGVRVVHALVQPAHRASIRVLEKLGLRPIGTQSDVHGGPDSLHYCLELAP